MSCELAPIDPRPDNEDDDTPAESEPRWHEPDDGRDGHDTMPAPSLEPWEERECYADLPTLRPPVLPIEEPWFTEAVEMCAARQVIAAARAAMRALELPGPANEFVLAAGVLEGALRVYDEIARRQ